MWINVAPSLLYGAPPIFQTTFPVAFEMRKSASM